MKRLILITMMAMVMSCSKDDSNPIYTSEPIFEFCFEYTFTADDEWVYLRFPGKSVYSATAIIDWNLGDLDTSMWGGHYINGKLVHLYADGAYSGGGGHKSGTLFEHDNYQFVIYVNDECINDGIYLYDNELFNSVSISHILNEDQSIDESKAKIQVLINRKPVDGDIFNIRFELWNFRIGWYI